MKLLVSPCLGVENRVAASTGRIRRANSHPPLIFTTSAKPFCISIRTARTTDGRAEVTVTDDGPGVPPENRDRIFQRFVTTRPGGNGLGLSTSRDIAQAHGGTLTLRDGGSGAAFVLTLPPA